jgi:hypothetical protein
MRSSPSRIETLFFGTVQRHRRMLGRSWFRIALRLRNRAIATAEVLAAFEQMNALQQKSEGLHK